MQKDENQGRSAVVVNGMGHRYRVRRHPSLLQKATMIRKLKSGEYRLYSRKKNVKTGKRRNLGTFKTLEKAKAHERAIQYFKRH